MNYTIRVFKVAQSDVPGPEVYWMSQWETWETLYFYIVLIQGGGKNILINTGPPQDLTVLNKAWTAFAGARAQMKREEDERPQNILKRSGLRAEDIDYVIVTPLQAYATANIPLFRRAQICISRKGWIEDFQAPAFHMHVGRSLRIPDDVSVYLQTAGWERLRLLENEDEVLPGINTFWAGVHHRSSQAICVATAKGKVIITDSFFKYPNVEKGLPLGVQESMEECMRTYERLRREGDILVPLYDPEVLQRFPGGSVA